MAIPTRIIKRRIKSVSNTRKIMKAMELVASSKMRKAVQQAVGTRPYAGEIESLTDRLRKLVDPSRHPLFVGTTAKNRPLQTLVMVAASDRGLCGGFNNQVLKKASEFIKSRANDQISTVTVGRRAEQALRRAGLPLVASFEAISNAPSFARTLPVSQMAANEFLTGTYDRVFLVYTDFKSALTQTPNVIQLLPIIPEQELSRLTEASVDKAEVSEASEEEQQFFEPDPDRLLASLLPKLIDMRLYHALLESSASEQASRMVAMKNAKEAAGEMLEDLTFTLNQARQGSITREISEIAAGKAAIE